MPKFEMEVPHNLPLPEVKARLDRAKGKLEADYQATCTWQGDEKLQVSRKGLNAIVNVEPARLRIDVELGLLLSPLAGTIRTGITKRLTELLAAPA
jgi:putative polyhydroxyalkanoate system protein